MKVYVGVIDHKHGTDIYAAKTQDGLYSQLAAFCREWWKNDGPEGEAPPSDRELVSAYFEYQSERGEEWHRTEEIELDAA